MKNSVKSDGFISSISGLKVIFMFLIFCWHSDLDKPPTDLGARACEFFFLAAGFLYFYAHKEQPIFCNARSIYRYTARKTARIWPVHFLAFLLTLSYIKPTVWFSMDGMISAILNLTLLHGFINNPSVYHSFNGVSWFCSAILFCYVCAPLWARILNSLRKAPLIFICAFFLRFLMEWVQTAKPGAFWNISIHVFPPLRMLEFVMGMSCTAMLLMTRSKFRPGFVISSICEIAITAGTATLMLTMQPHWLRAFYLLPFSLLIYTFSFNAGILSRLLSTCLFQFFSTLQLEFFLFHQVMFRMIQRFYPTLYAYPKREFIVCLLLTTILSWIYSKFLSKQAAACIQSVLNHFWHFLDA